MCVRKNYKRRKRRGRNDLIGHGETEKLGRDYEE
jgi:hypothetical protein